MLEISVFPSPLQKACEAHLQSVNLVMQAVLGEPKFEKKKTKMKNSSPCKA